jgi:hypothetical protein
MVLSRDSIEELSGKSFRFLRVYFPADDLPAPDVHQYIGVEKDSGNGRWEIGHIPAPDLIRPGRSQLWRFRPVLSRTIVTPMVEQISRPQKPVHRADTGKINPFV